MDKMLNQLEDSRCEAQMYRQVLEVKWLRLAATEGMSELEVLDLANSIMFETLQNGGR